MTEPTKAERLRQIPSVDELLSRPAIAELVARTDRPLVADAVRAVLDRLRQEILSGNAAETEGELAAIEQRVAAELDQMLAYSLVPVINASGVILHTNLGRAPLSESAVARLEMIARGYSNLEYDLARGERGRRDVHAARLLARLLGAEAAVVVNNNAAAVFLVLNTLAEGGEVIVSRGELVEIGGSFRIPEIMAKSGAVLREVGTTNRTRAADYEAAINERTRLLLRVHPSNFRMIGFVERPELSELLELGRKHNLPVCEDLGSGLLVDLAPFGVRDEPRAQEAIAAGADVVTFSGDKLLGGPQAGVIAGRKPLVERIRKNSLFRALRVDKLTYGALEATLRDYLENRLDAIPALRMIRMSRQELSRRAENFLVELSPAVGNRAKVELAEGWSVIGGGSTPGIELPTRLVTIAPARISATELESRLRAASPPVICRVEEDRVLLDLRTVFPEQEKNLAEAVAKALS